MATNRNRAVPAGTNPGGSRRDELRELLQARRRELLATLHDRMQGVRADHQSAHVTGGVLDEEEASGADVQEELELALIEMKAQTLGQIDEALVRLEAGRYGWCRGCGEEIPSSRLRALPFAVRCRDCEALHEAERARARSGTGRGHARLGDAESLGPDAPMRGR
jgi:DnaK suppressor protein